MYITHEDLIERFGEQEIIRLERNINDDNAIDTAIMDACDEVDGYLKRQYILPIPIITKSLKRACAIIARYYLHKDKASDTVRQDYEDIIAWLDKVASGKVILFDKNEGADDNLGATFNSGAMVV